MNQTITPNIPFIHAPDFEVRLKELNLSNERKKQIHFFAENGYLVFKPKIAEFNTKADKIIKDLKTEYRDHNRVTDAWLYNPLVKELAIHDDILEILEFLYQKKPVPFQTLNFNKGTQQATHSDIIHFNSVPSGFVAGVWIALEDIDEKNGAVHYYPGSHKLPFYTLADMGMNAADDKSRRINYEKYENFIRQIIEMKKLKKEVVKIPKGHALIWDANLLHGGDPIKDMKRTRHTQVTHYYFENCRYYTPLFTDTFAGKIAWKKVINIRTGKYQKQVCNGIRGNIPLTAHLKYFIEHNFRKHKAGRKALRKIRKLISGG